MKVFRTLKLRRYIRERQSIDNLVKKIKTTYKEEGKEIILGYGNWSAEMHLKGTSASMGKGLRRKLGKHFKVCLVSEYNTSQMCNRCGRKSLKKKRVSNAILGTKELHRVLVCEGCVNRKGASSQQPCVRIANRDKNASRNILEAFVAALKGEGRPEFLQQINQETSSHLALVSVQKEVEVITMDTSEPSVTKEMAKKPVKVM